MKEWELYDIEKDRTEWNNVAAEYPDVLKKMVRNGRSGRTNATSS